MHMSSPTLAPSKQDATELLRHSVPLEPELALPAPAARPASLAAPPSRSTTPRPKPSAASLYASTLTPPGSRSLSPAGRPASRIPMSGTRNVPNGLGDAAQATDSPTRVITGALIPHIAVYASVDTNQLAADKGFPAGLCEMLRPFGEDIYGKVTVRDSNGVSRSYDDFSVRFIPLGTQMEPPDPLPGAPIRPTSKPVAGQQPPLLSPTFQAQSSLGTTPPVRKPPWSKAVIHETEAVVDRHLTFAEHAASGLGGLASGTITPGWSCGSTSTYYLLYLRRLLSGISMSPHESFSHPVACVIAISSRNPDPITALRTLYAESSKGHVQLPPWVDPEYLRYYLLVHDEEKDDIARSMSLFDQMKRHFGLHCHLLRIRGSRCAESDDEAVPLYNSEWLTAGEELDLLNRSDEDDAVGDSTKYVFDSDAAAIRAFTREMVTQSIIPTMERSVAVWNDQVASRRRGISGRILNLSRRWGGFGASSRNSLIGGGAATSNFDPADGYYKPETAEATMRKLADYAFMLRDWKLAYATYDLLRSDYQTDKAWKFHAATNEMAAISVLMNPQPLSHKMKSETVSQLLEAAFFSYHSRCMATYGAARTALLGMELLRLRGGTFVDEAVKWGHRLLEARLLGPTGQVLLKERVAVCYGSKEGVTWRRISARRRKSAFWYVLATQSWIKNEKYVQAAKCLAEARKRHASLPNENGISRFESARDLMTELGRLAREGMAQFNVSWDEDSASNHTDVIQRTTAHDREGPGAAADAATDSSVPTTMDDASGKMVSTAESTHGRPSTENVMGPEARPGAGSITVPISPQKPEKPE